MKTNVTLIAGLIIDAAVNYKDTKLASGVVDRSIEFCGQNESQLFGTVSMNFAF